MWYLEPVCDLDHRDEEMSKEEVSDKIPRPSRQELANFETLMMHSERLVMVPCQIDGKDRYAIARTSLKNGRCAVELLAVVLHDREFPLLRMASGELQNPATEANPNIN